MSQDSHNEDRDEILYEMTALQRDRKHQVEQLNFHKALSRTHEKKYQEINGRMEVLISQLLATMEDDNG